jgi:CheY-like chemotaxis protein
MNWQEFSRRVHGNALTSRGNSVRDALSNTECDFNTGNYLRISSLTHRSLIEYMRTYSSTYFPVPVVLIPGSPHAALIVREYQNRRNAVGQNPNQQPDASDPALKARHTILVIDDNGAFRAHLQAMLERMGYAVATAEDGIKGLAAFRSIRPALVLTDIVMSEMDGIEVIRELRRKSPETKIVAMSGSGPLGSTDLVDLAVKLGANASIQKPIDRQALKEILSTLLDVGGHQAGAPAETRPSAA